MQNSFTAVEASQYNRYYVYMCRGCVLNCRPEKLSDSVCNNYVAYIANGSSDGVRWLAIVHDLSQCDVVFSVRLSSQGWGLVEPAAGSYT